MVTFLNVPFTYTLQNRAYKNNYNEIKWHQKTNTLNIKRLK